MQKRIESRLEEWLEVSWKDPSVSWQETWLENGFCQDCRFCCGPQPGDSPYPMPLLPEQLAARVDDRLYMLDSTTAVLDERGCKALGAHGCQLSRSERPLSCGLFPLVLCRGRLYLYTVCPASFFLPLKEWFLLARKAAAFLLRLGQEDQRRLSITLSDAFLRERCVALSVTLFSDDLSSLRGIMLSHSE